MLEERNVKWILGISVVMLLTSTFIGAIIYLPYSYPPRGPTIFQVVAFYINRIDILLFIVTITMATLATTGFGNKERITKASVSLFIVSMILFFASVLQMLFTWPWAS